MLEVFDVLEPVLDEQLDMVDHHIALMWGGVDGTWEQVFPGAEDSQPLAEKEADNLGNQEPPEALDHDRDIVQGDRNMVVVEGEDSRDLKDNMAAEVVGILCCSQNEMVHWGHYHMQAAAQKVPPLFRIYEYDTQINIPSK